LLTKLENDEATQRAQVIAELDTLNGSLDAPKTQKAQGEVAITQFEAVLKAFSDFTTKLVSVPDGGTTSPLAALAEIAVLRSFSANELILTVAVAGQGGEVETRKSIWTSGRIYHRAGTACTYTLFSNEGKIVDSGLVVADRQAKEGKRINKH